MSVQIIEENGKPAFAVVPMAEWDALIQRLEDLEDIAAGKKAETEENFPTEFVLRLLGGEHPLRVWREYRGMTLQALAEASGVTRSMLSMIENFKTKPSSELLSRLAAQLGCDMDDLYPSK